MRDTQTIDFGISGSGLRMRSPYNTESIGHVKAKPMTRPHAVARASKRRTIGGFLAVLASLLLTTANSADQDNPTSADLKLYVFDCGELWFDDVTLFGLSQEETATRRMFVPCYLIQHPAGMLLWDAGLDPSIAGKGEQALGEAASQTYARSLLEQLADLGLTSHDIDFIALSHMHFDHAGAANYFAMARLLIQDTEFKAAFEEAEDYEIYDFDLYRDLADNPRTVLAGDHDVFADGKVQILSAPGHTPGHQALLLRLENEGPVLLSGDLFHFRESRTLRRAPVFNTSAEQTLESMDKIEKVLEETGATLWIEHDLELAKGLRKAPEFYD